MDMNADGIGLAAFAVVLASLALFMRVKFPNASKASELAALLMLTAVFFSGCLLFLRTHAMPLPRVAPSASVEGPSR